MSWHIGRSFESHRLEDACPCPKEKCGLVNPANASLSCEHHQVLSGKTIRQSHQGQDCPSLVKTLASEIGSETEKYFSALDDLATKYELDSARMRAHLDGYGSDEAYEEWMQETWEPLGI